MRKSILLLILIAFCLLPACGNTPESVHRHEAYIYPFDVKVDGDTVFCVDGTFHGATARRNLYCYNLRDKSISQELILENIGVYEVTSDYIYYVRFNHDSYSEHQVSDFSEEVSKLQIIYTIYRYNRETKQSEVFISTPNLIKFNIYDNHMYLLSCNQYTIGNPRQIKSSDSVLCEYRVEKVSLEDSSISNTIFLQSYVGENYRSHFDSYPSDVTELPAVTYKVDISPSADVSFYRSVYQLKIEGEFLYVAYPIISNEKHAIWSIDMNDVGKQNSLLLDAANLYGMSAKDDCLILTYYQDTYKQAKFDLHGAIQTDIIINPQRASKVYDANGIVFNCNNGDFWYFDDNDKLHKVTACTDTIMHANYDFGKEPRIIYASDELIIFEEFFYEEELIRMEAVYKDGSSVTIPVTFKGIQKYIV